MKKIPEVNLAHIRKVTGISQQMIIDILEIPRQSMWQYLKKKRRITDPIVELNLIRLIKLVITLKKAFIRYEIPAIPERKSKANTYKYHYFDYMYTLLDEAVIYQWKAEKVIKKIMIYCEKTYFPEQLTLKKNKVNRFKKIHQVKLTSTYQKEKDAVDKIVKKWRKR